MENYVRVIGPVIAQMDRVEALLAEIIARLVPAAPAEPLALPIPQVTVEPPDLSALLAAISALRIDPPPDRTGEIIAAFKEAVAGIKPTVTSGGGTPKNLKVRDYYTGGEIIAPITGDDVAADVRFRQADEVWLRATGGTAYVDPFGGTADSDAIELLDGEWVPFNVRTDRVSLLVPTGVSVRGHTLRYDR